MFLFLLKYVNKSYVYCMYSIILDLILTNFILLYEMEKIEEKQIFYNYTTFEEFTIITFYKILIRKIHKPFD